MSEPLDDPGVTTLLRAGSDHLPPVDLAGSALARAHAVRRRRRTAGRTAATATVALAVAAVLVLPRSLGHDSPPPRTTPPVVTPSTTPAPGGVRRIEVPAFSADLERGHLVPADAERLPSAGLPLPADLTPRAAATTPPGQAVMVTKSRLGDQHLLYALTPAGAWHVVRVHAPADLPHGDGPHVLAGSLAPDGRTAVLAGASAVYVVDLATGRTRSYPADTPLSVAWQGDSRHVLVLPAYGTAEVLDVRAGTSPPAAVPVKGLPLVGAYDGSTLVSAPPVAHGTDLVEQQGGRTLIDARVPADRSLGPTALVAAPGLVAMTATPTLGPPSRGSGTGILVLRRPTYTGAAFLRVDGGAGSYGTGDALLARGWVSDDVLLLSITPETVWGQTIQRPRQVYLTWDTATGELREVGATDAPWHDSSWATALLR